MLRPVCEKIGFKFFIKPSNTNTLRKIVLDSDKAAQDLNASAVTITPTERSDV